MAKNSTELPTREEIMEAMRRQATAKDATKGSLGKMIMHKPMSDEEAAKYMAADAEAMAGETLQPVSLHEDGAFALIPIDQIDEPPVRVRWHYDPEKVALMRHDLVERGNGVLLDGQIQPIIVFRKPDARFEIVEGLTRVKAFQLNGRSPLIKAVIIEPLSPDQAYSASFGANDIRNDMADYDKGMSFRAALDAGIFSSQTILASKIGVSKQHVSGLLKFSTLDGKVREVIEQDKLKFGTTTAERLAAIQEHVSVEECVKTAEKVLSGWSVARLRSHAQKLLNDSSTPRKQKSGVIPIGDSAKVRYGVKDYSVNYSTST
ncbi:MAG: ParB/RepB/Spo0J family partition protein, partial [Deefgea sp.]